MNIFMLVLLVLLSLNYNNALAESSPKCSQPMMIGPCRAAVPRYAHEKGRCISFFYGGCLGNENNFSTEEECLKTCT